MKKQIKTAQPQKANETESDVNFDTDFEIDFDIEFSDFEADSNENNRYIKPKKTNLVPSKFVVYSSAQKLAKDINIKKGDRVYCMVSGDFVFGDFIEALICEYNFKIKEMTISTLSMSASNIESLAYLLKNDIQKLNLIISRFFYGHEIKKLVPEIYKQLDFDNKFQLAVCDSHSKICQFETEQGNKCVIYGSANLRASQNIEQFTIEQSSEIYDFNQRYFNEIIQKYSTIQKPIKYHDLYKLIEDVSNDENFKIQTNNF
jgi:hypothetical protein